MVGLRSEAYSLKVSLGAQLGNEMQMLSCLGHAEIYLWCTYKAHSDLWSNSWNKIRRVYHCLSDIGILCRLILLEFIGLVDWNRVPFAELDRQYIQHGRENEMQSRSLPNLCMRSIMLMKCIIKCLFQTATTPPTWSDYVRNRSLCWLFHRFYEQPRRITIFIILWYKLMKFEKRRIC